MAEALHVYRRRIKLLSLEPEEDMYVAIQIYVESQNDREMPEAYHSVMAHYPG